MPELPKSHQDRCFPVRGVYRVYEDTVRPVLLGRIGSEAIDPCTGRHPVYKYLAGDGGRLVGTELWFSAEGVVSRVANVSFECRLSNLTDPIVTNRSVELVPRRVKLPDPMAQARNVSLKSAAYRKNIKEKGVGGVAYNPEFVLGTEYLKEWTGGRNGPDPPVRVYSSFANFTKFVKTLLDHFLMPFPPLKRFCRELLDLSSKIRNKARFIKRFTFRYEEHTAN
ncbi:hypothetical protein AAG570_006059 [Ranatra chinensis]|uniref:Uncharacterized protein n=1 Tax=Ranatra chinensis TaxID=642074 RepID=A0ABD0YIN6_9HEMI